MMSNSKYCGECGALLKEGSRFCGACGTAVNQSGQKTESPHNPPGSSQRNRQKHSAANSPRKSGLEMMPLLLWTGTWSGALIIGSALLQAFRYGSYFLDFVSNELWVWLTAGLVAASCLQLFKISAKKPTGIMAGGMLFLWSATLFLAGWFYIDGVLMLPLGAFTGICTAWIISKQISRREAINIPRLSIIKLMAGWALCGLYAGTPYWHVSLILDRALPPVLFIIIGIVIVLFWRKK